MQFIRQFLKLRKTIISKFSVIQGHEGQHSSIFHVYSDFNLIMTIHFFFLIDAECKKLQSVMYFHSILVIWLFQCHFFLHIFYSNIWIEMPEMRNSDNLWGLQYQKLFIYFLSDVSSNFGNVADFIQKCKRNYE